MLPRFKEPASLKPEERCNEATFMWDGIVERIYFDDYLGQLYQLHVNAAAC